MRLSVAFRGLTVPLWAGGDWLEQVGEVGGGRGWCVCVGLAKQKEKPRYKDLFSSQRMAGCCCCLSGVGGGGDLHGVGGGNVTYSGITWPFLPPKENVAGEHFLTGEPC